MNLRIVLITQGVSRVVHPVLDAGYNIVGIVESAPRGKESGGGGYLRQWRRQHGGLPRLCRQRSIPYFYHGDNSWDFAVWLTAQGVDLIVVYSMSRLLTNDILQIPRYGVINLHPSLLPAYRGPNPWFWIYHDMVAESGVTLHYVDAGEDTGDIIYQAKFSISLGMKSPEMQSHAIGALGVNLIKRAIDALNQGRELPRIKQTPDSPTRRARRIKPAEHGEIIKWQEWSIDKVWHLMCGTELWLDCIPPPKGLYVGHRWQVMKYDRETTHKDRLGEIERYGKRAFVRCRDGRIWIECQWRLSITLRYAMRKLSAVVFG